jgi:hypothetical protein
MVIDIISYSDAQYALLNEEQIQEVKSAQVKKNRLIKQMEEALVKEKARLVNNGTYLSPMSALLLQEVREKYEAEIAWIREGLLFYLQFSSRVSEEEESGNPYPLDYSLSDAERFYLVRDYYLNTYSDPRERFEKFKEDTVAEQYLGEVHAPLYDYLLSYI